MKEECLIRKFKLTANEMSVLSSMVQVSDATYREILEQNGMFKHRYLGEIKTRMRSKLMQMQCEIESHSDNFPFEFYEREFSYKQIIPELRTKNVIIHMAYSSSPDSLPYCSKYKVEMSNQNTAFCRQMVFDSDVKPPYNYEQTYGILVFGGKLETFSVIQIPEPGFNGIAEIVNIPKINVTDIYENQESFERKKAVLKKEFLEYSAEENIS